MGYSTPSLIRRYVDNPGIWLEHCPLEEKIYREHQRLYVAKQAPGHVVDVKLTDGSEVVVCSIIYKNVQFAVKLLLYGRDQTLRRVGIQKVGREPDDS